MKRYISNVVAEALYAVLVKECEADPWLCESFTRYVADPLQYPHEFRFMGSLGFGGKFRFNGNRDGIPYVDCYPEDDTAQRKAVKKRANIALMEVWERSREAHG